MSKELWFESQLILNDFDSAAIAGVDQLCEPSVLRLGEEGEEGGIGGGDGRGGGLGREKGIHKRYKAETLHNERVR